MFYMFWLAGKVTFELLINLYFSLILFLLKNDLIISVLALNIKGFYLIL